MEQKIFKDDMGIKDTKAFEKLTEDVQGIGEKELKDFIEYEKSKLVSVFADPKVSLEGEEIKYARAELVFLNNFSAYIQMRKQRKK